MSSSDSKIGDIDFDALSQSGEEGDYPIDEVFGSSNLSEAKALGAIPVGEDDPNEPTRYYFFPAWRSQLWNFLAFIITSILSIWASRELTQVSDFIVVKGELFSSSSTGYMLHLPILVLIPGFFLSKILIRIYDAKYIIDEGGIEAQIGRMSLNFRQPRIRWEDIRGVEPTQTIMERILDIGTVKIGSAMTQETEIVMEGVSSPRAIQLLVEQERAQRHAEMKQSSTKSRQEYVSRD